MQPSKQAVAPRSDLHAEQQLPGAQDLPDLQPGREGAKEMKTENFQQTFLRGAFKLINPMFFHNSPKGTVACDLVAYFFEAMLKLPVSIMKCLGQPRGGSRAGMILT
ncbi:hypothetical protein HJFPF1_03167 [Paramyrothecium foliicola]|nr:hypothetical protein HJFPF1_03167 [Paramyrothecium foliicola]